MGGKSRWDYLKAIYSRYKKVSKPLRARILDEFCQVCGYNRKYAIRLLNGPAPQKPEVTKAKGRRPHLWCEGYFISDNHLGGLGLSMLSSAQSSPTVVAPLGDQALGDYGPSSKPTPLDQSRYHRPATPGQKAPIEKASLRTHQTRHLAQAPHPNQNRFLGCQNPGLYRNRSGLSLRQLRKSRVHPLAQRHRHSHHLGGNSCRYGQRPSGSA